MHINNWRPLSLITQFSVDDLKETGPETAEDDSEEAQAEIQAILEELSKN